MQCERRVGVTRAGCESLRDEVVIDTTDIEEPLAEVGLQVNLLIRDLIRQLLGHVRLQLIPNVLGGENTGRPAQQEVSGGRAVIPIDERVIALAHREDQGLQLALPSDW